MTEHHPDMDLIMALAGGELPPEEAARIEAELDPEARSELEAQRAALAALGQLRRPRMTLDESRRLRSATREELGLDPGHVQAARSQRRPGQWFARALPAMAAAASLVAVIAIAVNLMDGPGSDSEPAAATAAAAAPEAAPTTAAPPTTAAAYAEATTTTAAMVEATVVTEAEAMEEEPMAEEAMAQVPAAVEAAEEEADMVARDAADEAAAAEHAPTTAAVTTVGVTDTTEGESPADLAFAFSSDRPDDALLFTEAALAERGQHAFPLAELADRATAEGLACWQYVADVADPGDYVSFMGYGLIDGEEGEAYRIEPDPSSFQEDPDGKPPVILLFAYPDCRPVDFPAG